MSSGGPSGLPIVAEVVGQVLVFAIGRSADLTAAESAQFAADARRAIGDSRQAVFDLTHVEFIDSSGLGALVSLNRFLGQQGGELKLAGANRDVYTVFEMVRLHRLFEIHPSVEAAVGSFSEET